MKRSVPIVILACLLVGGLAFAATWLVRAQASSTAPAADATSPLAEWLTLTIEQRERIGQLDPRYREVAAELAEVLHQDRQALAELLESDEATDMQILEQVERVIDAHNALERRVAEHLVTMRHALEPEQRQRLGRHAADEVRRGMGQRWRDGQGQGLGRGGGAGRGMGRTDDQRPRYGQRRMDDDRPRADAMRGGGRVRQAIDELFAQHDRIDRHVEDLPDGVLTTTTSDDAEVAEALRLHVRQMKERLATGQPMRRGDPLFRALFEHHHLVDMHIEDVPGGVRVRQTSEDPQVVLLIRQHARVVSEFVEIGPEREHRPTPLPEGYRRR